ncbi:hypothetical protein LJY25_01220 [Hymenobacter sp. BT175]|uniref:hypothetical protein n=1 Tax=Hymenobacter translucens TaxID=2886507 RepID=UPI001D0DF06C|nr:hypothetical protein [Hymenobacter translucens]MCC2545050.1 hypothetical protein [Hymenobacter translucens]
MKNSLYLLTFVVALGLIGFLYYRITQLEAALKASEQRFHDCEQVTFQLQNQLNLEAGRRANAD